MLLACESSMEAAPEAVVRSRYQGSRVRIVAASLVAFGLAGIAVFVGLKGFMGDAQQIADKGDGELTELWGYDGSYGDGRVPCGWSQCDCSWAMQDPRGACGMVDNTPCWSCCCSRLYPELYRRAVRCPGMYQDRVLPHRWRHSGKHRQCRKEKRREGRRGGRREKRREPRRERRSDRRCREWHCGHDEWYGGGDFRQDPHFQCQGQGMSSTGFFGWGYRR